MFDELTAEYLQALFYVLAMGLAAGIVISVFILLCTEIVHTFKISTKWKE